MSMLRMIANSSKPEWAEPRFWARLSSLVSRTKKFASSLPFDYPELMRVAEGCSYSLTFRALSSVPTEVILTSKSGERAMLGRGGTDARNSTPSAESTVILRRAAH